MEPGSIGSWLRLTRTLLFVSVPSDPVPATQPDADGFDDGPRSPGRGGGRRPGCLGTPVFHLEWRIYRTMIDHNYLFHREVYACLRRTLVDEAPNRSGSSTSPAAMPPRSSGRSTARRSRAITGS